MHLPPSHCLQRHTGLIFLLESSLGVLRHASSGLPLAPAAHMAHLLAGECPRGPQACIFRPPTASSGTHGTSSCWRVPSGSSGMHLLASHWRQRHTWLIFLLESALGVLRHAFSGLPLPPAAHMAHLLAGELPRGPQACIFWPPTAASGTQGSSSCWRGPSGSSGMHLPMSKLCEDKRGIADRLSANPSQFLRERLLESPRLRHRPPRDPFTTSGGYCTWRVGQIK